MDYFIRNDDYEFLVEINEATWLVWDDDFRHAIHFADEEKAKKFNEIIKECFDEYMETEVVYIEWKTLK